MNRKVRVDIPESFYRPWNKEADDFFPCQHCKCRHEEGVEWDCPYGESTLADELIDQEKDENELIYVDKNLLNPEWVLTKGFHTSKGRTYRNRSLEYKNGVLSYIPLPLSDLKFPLLSFELAEGPRFAVQYFLRVRRNGIIAAIEFAEEIGEMPIIEDIFFEFYEAAVRSAGLRYTNLLFMWMIREFADIIIPVLGKIFRQGGLTYIDMKFAPLSKKAIDDYLGGEYSGDDGEFYETDTTSYIDGGWGFDYLEDGRYADYMPICELVDGEEECGLLIDDYWLQEGLDYDTIKVLHMFTVILDWITDLWGTSCALSVANAIVRAIPTLSQLVVYLKDMLAQELEI